MARDLTYNAPKIRFVDSDGHQEDFQFSNNNSTADVTSEASTTNPTHQSSHHYHEDENPFSDQSNTNSSESIHFQVSPPTPDDRFRPPSFNNNVETNSIYSESPNTTQRSQFQPLLSSDNKLDDYSNPCSSTMTQPAGFDRYPKHVQQPPSINRDMLHSSFDNNSNFSLYTQNSGSELVQLYDGDFSPFGGYPASSFPLSIDEKEPDDYLHNPDPVEEAEYDKNRFMYDLKNMDKRSMGGLFGFIALMIGALAVFIVLPVLTFTQYNPKTRVTEHEILTAYSYPMLGAIRQNLVDPDTPESALTWISKDGDEWVLVFSDEFNAEGRTFYDGDDQFFTAPDFHYAATQDLEWYDPDAVTTANGTLNLRLDAFRNHNLLYRSGMVQSWNKMCFTQGKLEFSARLPGYGNITGLWPGLWSMGNLGRPGYLASTEGVWPYTYNTCDAGITPNQSSPDGISYLPGQRLNSCTCPGESHPNPGVGRGAPEIDALEGEIHGVIGRVSQSLQIAPYDVWYYPDYDYMEIHNSSVTLMNTYTGGPFQQAVSGVTMLNTTWYQFGDNEHNFQKYGYEYLNDDENGYLRWFVGDDPTFTMYAKSLHPNGNIGWRQMPKEPISIIMNLGISNSWAYIDWPSLMFPSTMRVDYVRVYQPPNAVNVGCDPDDYPTYDYIQDHLNVYYNQNLTKFEEGGYTFPKNRLTGC
ncbi:Beta-glucan synthesis-associated protein SKN1 [Candida viswanathii]|uniref:Beta-glucan synthesis-associated protein SKN1 n=1 Tax=Candida viswanathii TaxID=5486 RepID=A0A367XX84_9ASCO|nr:Beta-glucan synthesis-associated protein SKN1 [Candida viswanathii]